MESTGMKSPSTCTSGFAYLGLFNFGGFGGVGNFVVDVWKMSVFCQWVVRGCVLCFAVWWGVEGARGGRWSLYRIGTWYGWMFVHFLACAKIIKDKISNSLNIENYLCLRIFRYLFVICILSVIKSSTMKDLFKFG